MRHPLRPCADGALLLLAALLCPPAAAAPPERLVDLVNPFAGTGGHGHTFPGASRPFGMVQLSPDTRLSGWDGCSGYHDSDRRVFGFSHTHLSGTGASDYGDVLVAPGRGAVRWENGDGKPDGEGYASSFRKETEKASPGYYRVVLDGPRATVELTAGKRVGLHRYTFDAPVSAASTPHLLFDLTHRDETIESWVRVVSDREVEGFRRSRAWAKDQPVYFTARFSRPFTASELWLDGTVRTGDRVEGRGVKAALLFPPAGGKPLVVAVGISAVDADGARRNLEAEAKDLDFDRVRREAEADWERELGKLRVEGGTLERRRVFATALYHAFLAPNLFTDVDRRYLGRDLKVHRAEGFDVYTVFSLWDTFRSAHPLYTLLERKRTADFVNTFVAQREQGGALPVWELWANETLCMIGYHAVPVVADAILSGVPGFDVEKAYEAMKASAEGETRGLPSYRRLGYVEASEEPESVSKTLEYAFDDWCIARVAERLGKKGDAERYDRRAQAYKNLFDPSTGFFRARMRGRWFTPFDPFEVNFNYTEANAWQYAFCVPHDAAGHARLLGGWEAYGRRLDELFSADSRLRGTDQPDITGLIGQYAHGNEPSHHVAWLYALAGRPGEAQRRVRQVLVDMYRDAPDGLVGNEDCGQMSAWYVLAAVGLYPVAPGSGTWVIGAPLFPSATLSFESGKRFRVLSEGLSERNVFVRSATLDGKRWTKSYLDRADLLNGGELVLTMGPEPGPDWGTAPADRPPSAIEGAPVLAAPFVMEGETAAGGAPGGSARVTLGCAEPGAAIRYTLDGREPGEGDALYEAPFEVRPPATLKMVATKAGFPPSPVVTAAFVRPPEGRTIVLGTAYRPRYSGGGDGALIDGVRGGNDFRLGAWQGYNGVDLDATVDLGSARTVRRVATGFLQDQDSWIFMPLWVEVAVSADGKAFRVVGTAENEVGEREAGTVVRDFSVAFEPAEARFVRVRARNRGVCPAWHKGAGEPAFVFADEVVVE